MIECSLSLISQTIAYLKEAGRQQNEGIVLWLGRPGGNCVPVEIAYRPLHFAKEDMFHIPREGMLELKAVLRAKRLMVAAQVHSHPARAFHSAADDRWAVVKHEGALSLVVPYFAAHVSVSNFFDQTKTFVFSPSGTWDEVPAADVRPQFIRTV